MKLNGIFLQNAGLFAWQTKFVENYPLFCYKLDYILMIIGWFGILKKTDFKKILQYRIIYSANFSKFKALCNFQNCPGLKNISQGCRTLPLNIPQIS